jgi:predicted transcriptional regulator
MTKQADWKGKLTEQQVKDLDAMLRDKAFTYKDIANTYETTMRAVSQYARRRGIRRFKSRKDSKIAPVKPAITLSAVEGELEALMARVEELKQKRASMLIRFERDGENVLVYGVGECLAAPAQAWLAFLNAEGARRLREFCLQAVKR